LEEEQEPVFSLVPLSEEIENSDNYEEAIWEFPDNGSLNTKLSVRETEEESREM
jgi:hypothetical protein